MAFDLLSFLLGLALGAGTVYVIIRNSAGKASVEQSNPELYVSRSIFNENAAELKLKISEVTELNYKLAQYEEKTRALEEKLETHKSEITDLNERMRLEFQSLSNKIFEEKSTKFLELNEKKVFDLLNPLKERIQTFEKKVEDTYKEETRERISLKKEIEIIARLNQQVSEDTNRLTNALKGNKKMQGDWGELQLEMILNRAGLEKDIHYIKQGNFKDEDGNNLRPDYILNLPDGKCLVLDSKVSLVAYENYFNEEDDNSASESLKTHVQNLTKHISDLNQKNYQNLYSINAPDYVLMFVPIEPALYSALKEEPKIFEKALEKNVVLVSTSTLLATLRTISYIWKQDNARKNVDEIARESGALYEKFIGFIEDLTSLGNKLDGVKRDYQGAMNKLIDSPKKGDTIVGRIERIKKLGAKTSKSLPGNILDRLED